MSVISKTARSLNSHSVTASAINANFFITITIKTKAHINITSNQFCSSLGEHFKYNQALHQSITFPYVNIFNQSGLSRLIVSFRFRSIEFNKKRALPFFLALELLTNQKCVASLSNRNVQAWKIRKGRLVGCKVILRNQNLNDFLDILSLTFPRREKFQPARGFISKFFKKNAISKITFSKTHEIEIKIVKTETGNFPSFCLILGELVLFYPFEMGLGLHADVQRMIVNFRFSAFSIEECFFVLRYNKIPILP